MRQSQRVFALLAVAVLLLAAHAFQTPAQQQRGWTRPAVLKPRAAAAGVTARSMKRQQAGVTTMVMDPASIVEGVSSAPVTLLAADAWVGTAKSIIEPVLDLGGIAFLIRIILSWYPQIDLNKAPVNFIAWPTEPFLKATRVVVPPAFGVDISPIIWFAFLNFLREILISDQGILTILSSK